MSKTCDIAAVRREIAPILAFDGQLAAAIFSHCREANE
jgi:hypothetical protein